MAGTGASPASASGILLTLEGPGGPSSVELSGAECVELAEAVSSAVAANGQTLEQILVERFPAGSPIAGWAAAVRTHRHSGLGGAAALPGGDGLGSSPDDSMLALLQGSLAAPSGGLPSAAGRLLMQLMALAMEVRRQRSGFDRAVVEARIESMKQLAYGAGHEINNPLANIATRAQSLLPGERDPDRRRRLSAIIDQAFRARDMIGGLMLFARPPKPVRREATAQAIVAAAVDAVEAMAEARGVRIVVESVEPDLTGLWDSSQLEEAVRAVLLNAIEASRGSGEVRVFVATDVSEPVATDASNPVATDASNPVATDASNPACCLVRVVDNGPGMDRETLARAFDPFFSGREAGRGIGLGLSKVWRLVEINGGRTMIDSRYGVGTTVSIQLPMSSTARSAPAGSPHPLQCDARR